MTYLVAARGTPDWQGSFRISDFLVLRAFDDSTLCFAVPVSVRLAQKNSQTPDFFLEFVSDRNGTDPEESLYAMLDMGLTWGADIHQVYDEMSQRAPGAAFTPSAFGVRTCWHLQSANLSATMPFAWEDAQRARIHCRLSASTGNLLYASLQTGAMPSLRAAVECEVAAVLPRVDAVVSFSPAKLLARLALLKPSSPSIPFLKMVRFFEDSHPDVLQIEGSLASLPSRDVALALAGRVCHSFGQPAPCPEIVEGPHVILTAPSESQSILRWDLRTPLLTGTPVFLDFDPFTPIVAAGGRDQVTRFTRIPPLPEDLLTERVTVAAGLPPNIQNLAAVELTLRVAQDYSRSGSAAFHAITLSPPADQSPTVELTYKKIGPKPYSARLSIVSEDSVEELPWFDCSGDYLYIGADQLPGTCVTVRATTQLLAQANIRVDLSGTATPLTARLTDGQNAASFVLNETVVPTRLIITASERSTAAPALQLDLPCLSVNLDLSSFRQYGHQTVFVTVQFEDSVDIAQFEFLPEGEADSIVLAFSHAQPSGQFSYFAKRLFGNRFRFRPLSWEGESEAEWSPYQSPDNALTIPHKAIPFKQEKPDLV